MNVQKVKRIRKNIELLVLTIRTPNMYRNLIISKLPAVYVNVNQFDGIFCEYIEKVRLNIHANSK